MDFFSQQAADTSEIFAEFGKDVLWNNTPLKALIVDPVISQDFLPGGFVDQASFTIKFLRSDFHDHFPQHGDAIQYDGETFIINKVTNRPPHALVIVEVIAEAE